MPARRDLDAVHDLGTILTTTRDNLKTRLLQFAQDYSERSERVQPERLFEAVLADRRVHDALVAVFDRRAGRTDEPLDHEDIRLLDLLLAALSALRIEEALLIPDPACVDPDLAPQFDYDEQGNAIQGPDQGVCQLFDERGQLIELSVPRVRLMPNPCRDASNRVPFIRYEYDWRGRRVLEDHLAFGPDRRFAYDQNDRLIAEYAVREADSALIPLRQYFYHGGEPIAQADLGEVELAPGVFSCGAARASRSGAGGWATALLLALAAVLLPLRRRRLAAAAAIAGTSLLVCIPAASATHTVRYYINDGLGTPLRLVGRDAAGQPRVDWAAEYGPFGEDYVGAPSAVQPLRFPGQYDDGTLHYNLHRNYAPAWGRYLEVDPWATGPRTATEYVRIESSNPYLYARNNPLEFFDPEGLYPVTVQVECPGVGTAE
jgi:RHS repeat-associated protein